MVEKKTLFLFENENCDILTVFHNIFRSVVKVKGFFLKIASCIGLPNKKAVFVQKSDSKLHLCHSMCALSTDTALLLESWPCW